MKKAALFLLIALFIMPCLSVYAEGALPLRRAATPFDAKQFEKYASYQYDEATGLWSCYNNEAAIALKQIADDGPRDLCYFYVELNGNARTAMLMPVLTVYYMGARAVNATAVSFLVGDTRYDFPVNTEQTSIGSRRAEKMRVMVTGEALNMLREIAAAKEVRLRLHGEEPFSSAMTEAEEYKNTAERIKGTSVTGVRAAISELDAIGFGEYCLYDLNAARWELDTGNKVKYRSVPVLSGKVADVELDDYDMIYRGDKGDAVTELNEQLLKQGYLYKKATTYGDDTCEAVKMAQQFFGLLPTGSADRQLIECLFNDNVLDSSEGGMDGRAATPVTGAAAADADVSYSVGDVAEISLSRYWFAKAAVSSRPSGSMSEKSGGNADNLLLIADGAIKNISSSELGLFWQVTGQLKYDGKYAYPLAIVCEGDDGTRFDNTLIPLAGTRLVVYAEVPKDVTSGGGAWTLELTAGETTLTYALGE